MNSCHECKIKGYTLGFRDGLVGKLPADKHEDQNFISAPMWKKTTTVPSIIVTLGKQRGLVLVFIFPYNNHDHNYLLQ